MAKKGNWGWVHIGDCPTEKRKNDSKFLFIYLLTFFEMVCNEWDRHKGGGVAWGWPKSLDGI